MGQLGMEMDHVIGMSQSGINQSGNQSGIQSGNQSGIQSGIIQSGIIQSGINQPGMPSGMHQKGMNQAIGEGMNQQPKRESDEEDIEQLEQQFKILVETKFQTELRMRVKNEVLYSLIITDPIAPGIIRDNAQTVFEKYKRAVRKYGLKDCLSVDTYIKMLFDDSDIVSKLIGVIRPRTIKNIRTAVKVLENTEENPDRNADSQPQITSAEPGIDISLSDESEFNIH